MFFILLVQRYTELSKKILLPLYNTSTFTRVTKASLNDGDKQRSIICNI